MSSLKYYQGECVVEIYQGVFNFAKNCEGECSVKN